MLALSLAVNVLSLVALGVVLALCRDLGALAHDLMDPTQRGRLVRAPQTLSMRVLRWLMRRKDAPTFTFGVATVLWPSRKRP